MPRRRDEQSLNTEPRIGRFCKVKVTWQQPDDFAVHRMSLWSLAGRFVKESDWEAARLPPVSKQLEGAWATLTHGIAKGYLLLRLGLIRLSCSPSTAPL